MKHLTWRWWLLLVAFTLLFMLLRLPASLLGSIVAAQTDGKLQLAAAQGSIWHGSAQPTLQGAALAERLDWNWRPAELLHGRLGYNLHLDGGQAILALGWNSISLQQADLTVAAAPLFQLDQRSQPYGLTGQLHLNSPQLQWQKGKPTGQLTLAWRGAASSLVPAISPLGDYQLNLMPAGDGWRLQLSTLNGPLQLNGGGDLRTGQGLAAEVAISAAAGSEAPLAPFLNQIGPGAPGSPRTLRFNFR